jgi:hypothetical protein
LGGRDVRPGHRRGHGRLGLLELGGEGVAELRPRAVLDRLDLRLHLLLLGPLRRLVPFLLSLGFLHLLALARQRLLGGRVHAENGGDRSRGSTPANVVLTGDELGELLVLRVDGVDPALVRALRHVGLLRDEVGAQARHQ